MAELGEGKNGEPRIYVEGEDEETTKLIEVNGEPQTQREEEWGMEEMEEWNRCSLFSDVSDKLDSETGSIIRYLINHGADPNTVDAYGRSPLHHAAMQGNDGVAEELLRCPGIIVDVVDAKQATPMHYACQNGHMLIVRLFFVRAMRFEPTSDVEIRKLLMSEDCEGKTPLDLAVDNGHSHILDHLLHLPCRFNTVSIVDFLIMKGAKLDTADEVRRTPLLIATECGHSDIVRLLLSHGADARATDKRGRSAIYHAALFNRLSALKILLNDKNGQELVDESDRDKCTPLHRAVWKGHVNVVKLLIQSNASVALTDLLGRNCLDVAIDNSQTQCALAIVQSDKWKEALRNCRPADGPLKYTTPFRELIKYMPDVAEVVLDKCTKSRYIQDDPDCKINFDFEFLDDSYQRRNVTTSDGNSTTSKTVLHQWFGKMRKVAVSRTSDSELLKNSHPLMIMGKLERENLLNHPLVTALLRHKWNSYGRYVYYPILLIYVLFLTFLTIFVVGTPATFMFQLDPNQTLDFDELCATEMAKGMSQNAAVRIGKYVIYILTAVQVLKELFQVYQRRWNYIGWENLIEWIVYITTLLLILDFSDCSGATGLRHGWQWPVGAVCIFFAWINLVLFIRKLPGFGIYVVMFVHILRTFIRFFIVFLPFVVAFALAFFALFQNQPSFRSVWSSLLKTTVMMMGEFEYNDLFNSQDGSFATTIFYSEVSHSLFLTFVLIMTILIMNLLIGLAVNDINGVQSKAVVRRAAALIELVLRVEQAVPEQWRRHWMVGHAEIYPNKSTFIGKFKRWVMGGEMGKAKIGVQVAKLEKAKIALKNNKDNDKEEERVQRERTAERIDQIQNQQHEMQSEQQRLHSMMKAVMDHLKIPSVDQQYD